MENKTVPIEIALYERVSLMRGIAKEITACGKRARDVDPDREAVKHAYHMGRLGKDKFDEAFKEIADLERKIGKQDTEHRAKLLAFFRALEDHEVIQTLQFLLEVPHQPGCYLPAGFTVTGGN